MSKAKLAVSVALGALIASAAPLPAGPSLQRPGDVTQTQVVLYSTSSAALVRQRARLHVSAGLNRLTFTWASAKISESSVRLSTPLTLTVGGSTKPAGTEKTLAWDVAAVQEGDYVVTIMCLLSDLKWSPSYRLEYTPGAQTVTLEGYLTLTNESGLALQDAQMEMIIGRPGSDLVEADAGALTSFTLADVRDLPVGSRARARFLPATSLAAELVHRIDSEHAAEQVQRVLVVQPPSSGNLAQEALPKGGLQVIETQAEAPARRLLSTELSYKPGEEFELGLGVEPDIVVERQMLDQRKVAVEFDRLGRVSGFDTVEKYRLLVRNRLGEAVDIEVVEVVLNTWDFSGRAAAEEDGRVTLNLTVPAGLERSLEFTLTKHSGTRIP